MPHKQVLFRSAAREKILRGATQLCDAVRVTLGPKSKSVLIQKSWGSPIVCNDGVTIAKEGIRSEGSGGKPRCTSLLYEIEILETRRIAELAVAVRDARDRALSPLLDAEPGEPPQALGHAAGCSAYRIAWRIGTSGAA